MHVFECVQYRYLSSQAERDGTGGHNILELALYKAIPNKTSLCCSFLAKNRAANYQELGKKKKPFAPRVLSVRIQHLEHHANNTEELSPARQCVSGAFSLLSNRKHSLFQKRYFESGPLEPGYGRIRNTNSPWTSSRTWSMDYPKF